MKPLKIKNASVNVTTTANGFSLNEFAFLLILGATTIERGLMRVIPSVMDKVFVPRFRTDLDVLIAPEDTPSTLADAMHKDDVEIVVGDAMFYDRFNPLRDFQEDWTQFYATGRLTEAQAAPKIRAAIEKTVIESVQNGLENLIWNGDTASGDEWLNRFDGLIKIIEADGSVNLVTPAGVIDKTNIIDVLEGLIDATPDAVLEKSTPKIVLSHRDKYIYHEALRDATISKGINIQDGGVDRFAGIPMISTGIPKDHLVLGNVTSGNDSNFVAATWMEADSKGLKIDRLQADSELWFAKVLFKFGVNIIQGEELTYYKPV